MEHFYIRLSETTDQEVAKLHKWATSTTKDFEIIKNSWSTLVVGSLRSVTEEKTFINLVRTNTRNWRIKHLPFDNWIHKISRDEYIDLYGGYSDIQAMVYKLADSAVDKSLHRNEEARQLKQYKQMIQEQPVLLKILYQLKDQIMQCQMPLKKPLML